MVKAFPLVVALLLSVVPGSASEPAPVQNADEKAHPELLRLEKDLSDKQSEKKDGSLPPEQYQEWEREFRSKLEESFARVPPSPENTAAHTRITALLGGREQAGKALDQALESNPDSPVLLRTKSQLLYEQKDYAGAAQYGLQAWEKSGRTDQNAWALYQMTRDRGAPSGATTSPLPASGPAAAAANPSQEAPAPTAIPWRQQPSDVPLPGQESSAPEKGKSPKWPLTVPIALGLIGYGLYRAKQNEADGDSPAGETKTASTAAMLSVAAGPAAEAAKKVMAEAVANVAKAAAARVAVAAAITGATFTVIAGAGVATIYGLEQMIEAQDKYNDSIAQFIKPSLITQTPRESVVPVSPTVRQTEDTPDYADPQRSREYLRAKDFCDGTPPLGDNECSNLSKLIDHAEQCIGLYEKWDDRWQPKRHKPKIDSWKRRLQNLKNDHRARCTQK